MNARMKILVTGGCGFIGSNLIRMLIQQTDHVVLNLDALTYAGNRESLDDIAGHERYSFSQINLCNAQAVVDIVSKFRPDWIMHLAAESHVDRSIDGPSQFIETNIVGTFHLLQAARHHYDSLAPLIKKSFRFLHVSTDEVYGSLGPEGLFTEKTPYDPRSPYSASKAASDHMARAWHHTYGLPVLITNCSNNYGPYQFPEKLIPVVILKALRGESIPVYGNGENIRDWLYVGDHIEALYQVISGGRIGHTYNIGGNNECRNIDLVKTICRILDELQPSRDGQSYANQITFVEDRPGHDMRYAIDPTKIREEIGWAPKHDSETGFRSTVRWYLENPQWTQRILDGSYNLDRLGRA
jgi:dTDP-glucose 4,6-dehydratase